jgi:hypothetical protein
MESHFWGSLCRQCPKLNLDCLVSDFGDDGVEGIVEYVCMQGSSSNFFIYEFERKLELKRGLVIHSVIISSIK